MRVNDMRVPGNAVFPCSSARASMGLAMLVFACAAKAFANDAASPQGGSLELGPSSVLSLNGDSTLHKYSAKAQDFSASFELGPANAKSTAPSGSVEALFRNGEIKSVELLLPVAKISSGEGGLDDNLRKALHSDEHRNILFHITSYTLAPSPEGAALALTLHGSLVVAGVSKDIDVVASGVPSANGIVLTGSKDLLMSDYNVKAPVLMLGMLKTKDLITIKFDLAIQRGS